MTATRLLLALHLSCAFSATAAFWVAGTTSKGGRTHRAAGQVFARLIYGTALSGALLAVLALITSPASAVAERRTMWFVLYVLLIIVAPVQHGLAVVAAGAEPARVRSRWHAALSIACMLGSLAVFPAALLWERWVYLIVAPIGLVVGVRNMSWATRRRVTMADVRAEHLTSLIVGGVTLHTALLVFGTSRSLGLTLVGPMALLPWTVPALVGVVVLWRLLR